MVAAAPWALCQPTGAQRPAFREPLAGPLAGCPTSRKGGKEEAREFASLRGDPFVGARLAAAARPRVESPGTLVARSPAAQMAIPGNVSYHELRLRSAPLVRAAWPADRHTRLPAARRIISKPSKRDCTARAAVSTDRQVPLLPSSRPLDRKECRRPCRFVDRATRPKRGWRFVHLVPRVAGAPPGRRGGTWCGRGSLAAPAACTGLAALDALQWLCDTGQVSRGLLDLDTSHGREGPGSGPRARASRFPPTRRRPRARPAAWPPRPPPWPARGAPAKGPRPAESRATRRAACGRARSATHAGTRPRARRGSRESRPCS